MIPTFVGITFMVFFILQIAPDGPFERAVKQLKNANAGSESGISMSSDVTGDSSELTPELLEKLRMQYGLDKPIVVRYLIWLGVFPKEYKSKSIEIGKSFRESVDNVSVSKFQNYLLQRYVRVDIDDNEEYQIIETGVGLEFELPNINQLKIDDNFNREKYIHFQNEYQELPSNPNMIETWYFSDWKVKKMNTEKNTVILTKRKFNGILQGFLGYSDKKGKNVSTLIAERLHISAFFGLTSLFLGYLVCIPLGIMKALKHGQKFDVISSIIVFVGYSIPGYALGVL
ncbi:MAG: hypothetical protein CMG25_00470, partial [Candidatus Marinimicrobia bacterium]|nr:hypothetical protein [Candidatus Neomarinimicrobiota bacterium]